MSNTFKPLQVGQSKLSNRLVLAPLTRLRSPDHVPTDLVVEYYRQRAAGEPGSLLITEATFISPQAGGYPTAPGIYSEEQIKAWKKVTDAVHEEKSFIYLQLWALGRQASAEVLKKEGPYPVVGPSAIPMKNSPDGSGEGPTPEALTLEGIKQYVEWYTQAAKNAIEAGFDGVEIHGANGYLLDQFLHANSNHRTDEYGGSIENQARFTLEVVDSIVKEVGADRTAIRLSPWGDFGDVDPGVSPIPQWSYVTAELEKRAQEGNRLAYIHVVEPRVEFFGDDFGRVDRHLNNFFRDIWQGVLIRAGGFGRDYDDIAKMETEDDKLLIALGRLYISNPDLVKKVKESVPLDMYNRPTFYWDGSTDPAIGYTKDVKRK